MVPDVEDWIGHGPPVGRREVEHDVDFGRGCVVFLSSSEGLGHLMVLDIFVKGLRKYFYQNCFEFTCLSPIIALLLEIPDHFLR